MSSLANTALTPNGSAGSKKSARKSSSPRRRSVARDSSEVKVAAAEAGVNEEVEEEVAGGDEEADPSSEKTCITTHWPQYHPGPPESPWSGSLPKTMIHNDVKGISSHIDLLRHDTRRPGSRNRILYSPRVTTWQTGIACWLGLRPESYT
jgi:hypothetical protein